MNLSLILKLINELIAAVKELLRKKQVKELEDAKNEALESRDQRKLEISLGGSSGPVAPDKYLGLSIRERKKAHYSKEKK